LAAGLLGLGTDVVGVRDRDEGSGEKTLFVCTDEGHDAPCAGAPARSR
jgi:hypothetical protein